jgi:hypothetical protein
VFLRRVSKSITRAESLIDKEAAVQGHGIRARWSCSLSSEARASEGHEGLTAAKRLCGPQLASVVVVDDVKGPLMPLQTIARA